MTERAVIYATALVLVALCALAMASMHQQHYKNRKFQLLEGRLASLEKIVVGDHD